MSDEAATPDDEMPDVDSGPFCVHWGEPGSCDELCACGHRCHTGGCCDVCDCEECDAPEINAP